MRDQVSPPQRAWGRALGAGRCERVGLRVQLGDESAGFSQRSSGRHRHSTEPGCGVWVRARCRRRECLCVRRWPGADAHAGPEAVRRAAGAVSCERARPGQGLAECTVGVTNNTVSEHRHQRQLWAASDGGKRKQECGGMGARKAASVAMYNAWYVPAFVSKRQPSRRQSPSVCLTSYFLVSSPTHPRPHYYRSNTFSPGQLAPPLHTQPARPSVPSHGPNKPPPGPLRCRQPLVSKP